MNMTKKHAKRGSESDNTPPVRYLALGNRVPVASKEVPVASRRVGVASKGVRVASERVPIGAVSCGGAAGFQLRFADGLLEYWLWSLSEQATAEVGNDQ